MYIRTVYRCALYIHVCVYTYVYIHMCILSTIYGICTYIYIYIYIYVVNCLSGLRVSFVMLPLLRILKASAMILHKTRMIQYKMARHSGIGRTAEWDLHSQKPHVILQGGCAVSPGGVHSNSILSNAIEEKVNQVTLKPGTAGRPPDVYAG